MSGRIRSWTVEKVWGDDAFAGEPLPALNAMRAGGQLPLTPTQVCSTKVNEGNGHHIKVEAVGLADDLVLVVVRDHRQAKYIALAQDNGVVS